MVQYDGAGHRQLSAQDADLSVVFWRLAKVDTNVASARYRVGLPALFLEKLGVQSRLFEHGDRLPLEARPTAVIFSKSFTADDIDVARQAVELGIPVMLDLCDNIFVKGYRTDRASPKAFAALAELAAAVIVPSPALAEVIRHTIPGCPSIYEIPDGVETRQLLRRIVQWMLVQRARDLMQHPSMSPYGEDTVWNRASFHARTTARAATLMLTLLWRRGVSHGLDLMPASARIPATEAAATLALVPRALYRRIQWVRASRAHIGERVHYWRTSWQQDGTQWLLAAARRKLGSAREGDAIPLEAVRRQKGEAIRPGDPTPVTHPGKPARQRTRDTRPRCTLIWFGNYGASYSQFGMKELAALSPAIVEISRRWDVEVLVVSNSRREYETLIRPLPFRTRYIEWSLDAIYLCLRLADVALIPNALDAFSLCKSANRTILALSAGVPVVATRTPALEPLASCVTFDDWVHGIESYLQDQDLVARHVKNGAELMEARYSGRRIAEQWHAVLKQVHSATLGRTREQSVPVPNNRPLSMAFATFHIDTSQDSTLGTVHPNTNLQRREYLAMIDLMFRSARLFHPRCRCVILSNSTTDLDALPGKYEVSVHHAHAGSLMLDRTRAMADFLDKFDFRTPLVFLDSDILLNGNLYEICRRPFDVALTYRNHPKPPINGGVILLNHQRPDACKRFFARFLSVYLERHAEERVWFGDQEALYDLIGQVRAPRSDGETIEVDGCRVLLLPCEQYNFSPESEASAIATPLRGRSVIHFKGPRKSLMPLFWHAYLGPRERLTMGTLGKSIATRFDLWQSRRAK